MQQKLMEKFTPYLKLISGEDLREPSPDESMMAISYSMALRSSCYKRQVGAVVVNKDGVILSVGCNENPSPLGSCIEEFGKCYRDIFKKKALEEIMDVEDCPNCKEKLAGNISSEFKCKKCDFDLDKHFNRDRALSRCTALHAEETAIIRARTSLKDCTIYTTTYPCLLCAEKIVATGINEVVYCESYPDSDSEAFFKKTKTKTNIDVRKFEGVKARAYFRMFSSWRSWKEESIKE
jgi:deoxycytidylate deaminase